LEGEHRPATEQATMVQSPFGNSAFK
jgi:hypothetical protein